MIPFKSLRRIRQTINDARLENDSVELWSSVWLKASEELKGEVSQQIASRPVTGNGVVYVKIDDPMHIAELATMYKDMVDADGSPITFRSVQNTVTLRILPKALHELKLFPEVRAAMEKAAAHRAVQAAPQLEKAIRRIWSKHVKVRTRSRFLIEGFVHMPDGSTALNVLIIESYGYTSRDLLPVKDKTVKAVRSVSDNFNKFPTIIVALGAKAKREIAVVPQHSVEFSDLAENAIKDKSITSVPSSVS